MQRFERLGIAKDKHEYLQRVFPEFKKGLEKLDKEQKFIHPESAWGNMYVGDLIRIAEGAHILEFPKDFTKAASELSKWMNFQLLGNWQNTELTDKKTVDPKWWHVHNHWRLHFTEYLVYASAVNDWEGIGLSMSFFDDQVSPSATHGRVNWAIVPFYCGMRAFFEDENKDSAKKILAEVAAKPNAGWGKMAECVLGIIDKDEKTVQKAWNVVYKNCQKDCIKYPGYLGITREATFLFHLARHNGLTIPLKEQVDFDRIPGADVQ